MTPAAGETALKPGVSVVVAVYNGATTLEALTGRIRQVFAAQPDHLELIFVNDASTDGSWAAITALAARHRWVRGVDLARNVGQHNALLCGIRLARHAVVVTMDDDLQHAPEDIPRLVEGLSDGADLVYGIAHRQRQSPWRVAGSVLLGLLLRARGNGGAPRYSAFRAFRTRLRRPFAERSAPNVCIDVLLSWGTARIATASVPHHGTAAPRSRYSPRKLLALAVEAATGFGAVSATPAILLGILLALSGGGAWLATIAFPLGAGSTPLPAITLLAGLQLCLIGWLGTYVTRLFDIASGRPPYVIAATTDAVTERIAEGVAEGAMAPGR